MSKPSIADRVAIAKRWIEKGYHVSTVLNFVGLASSTYYYNLAQENKGDQPSLKKRIGRKISGYSMNKKGENISDKAIKKYLIELIAGDGYPYGYKKLTVSLKEDYNLIINHKKVYRLCKELDILRPQRKIYYKRPRKLAKKEKVTGSNQLWQMDLKYGYITGIGKFFFQLSVIDVFDKTIIDYHLGLSAKAKDASRVLTNALKKRDLRPDMALPVIRTDNGPQFISKLFKKTCESWNIEHERIPVKTPNLNAYIESFHAILEDECYRRHEFKNFTEVYQIISEYIDYYNTRRRHSSINYMTPYKFYKSVVNGSINAQSLVA